MSPLLLVCAAWRRSKGVACLFDWHRGVGSLLRDQDRQLKRRGRGWIWMSDRDKPWTTANSRARLTGKSCLVNAMRSEDAPEVIHKLVLKCQTKTLGAGKRRSGGGSSSLTEAEALCAVGTRLALTSCSGFMSGLSFLPSNGEGSDARFWECARATMNGLGWVTKTWPHVRQKRCERGL